ncbi:MAG: MFS transporter [Christensenellales bacterium]
MKQESRSHIPLFEFLTFSYWFSISVFGPYLVTFMTQLGADDLMIGLVNGSYGLAMVMLLIPVGIMSDKINNRKLFIILGCVAASASIGGTWLTSDIWLVLIFRLLLGVSLSCWGCFSVLFGSYYPSRDSIKAQGILTSWNYVGQALSCIAAAIIGTYVSIRATFLVGFLVSALSLATSFFVRETPIKKASSRFTFAQLLSIAKDPWIVKVSVMGFTFQIVLFSAYVGFTAKLAINLGANAFQLSMLSFIFVLTSIPTSYFCGQFFGRKFGERNSLMVTSFLFALCCILQPFSSTLTELFIIQAVAGLVRGIYYPMLMGMSIKKTPYEKQAAAMGVFQGVYSIGITLGPILTGAIGQLYSMTAAFCVAGVIGMVTPLICAFGIKNEYTYRS